MIAEQEIKIEDIELEAPPPPAKKAKKPAP